MPATASSIDTPVDPTNLEAWLTQLPADPCAAFAALRQQVQALSVTSIAADERLHKLDRIRMHALELMPSLRSQYVGKPIPLDGTERDAWENCVGLWEAFYFSYALCSEADPESAAAARVWYHALDCLGRAMREYALAYRAVPAKLWKELNSCYRTTEDCAITEQSVAVEGKSGVPQTCKAVYLTTLMFEAANPCALSVAQMQALDLLLPNWMSAINLTPETPADTARSPLAVDLLAESGARLGRALEVTESLRYLDTSALAPRLRDLGAAVRAGTLPLEFAAARSLQQVASERLLTHLYIQWCSAGAGRREERRDVPLKAQVALNMHAIHFQISGRAFRQPGLRYTREEEHDLATFGHITGRTEQRLLTARSSALEPWEVVNQSASGMLGMVRKPELASRLNHGQLIAMRTSSMEPPLLAQVQRMRIEHDGALSIGVRAVRADVRGAAVRPIGDAALKYERALIVAADSERNVPAHVIVPTGQFRPGSVFELHSGRAEKVVAEAVLEQCVDHERVTYKLA